MSQVIIDNAPIYEIADILRDKAVITGKVHHKDMPAAIKTFHGYRTTVRVLSSKPSAYAETRYTVMYNPHSAVAAKNTSFLHAESKTIFNIENDLTFITKASQGE